MAFDYTKSTVYFRDGFVPFGDANLSIASSPVLYGLTIYTVFGANWNPKEKALYAFRLQEHYKRLVNSARIMDFNLFAEAWPWEKFERTMLELLQRNQPQEDVLVRVAVFVDALIAGTRMHDLPQALSAYVYPLGEILPRDGINVCVSSWVRTADNAIPSRAKVNGSYINASLMKNEALLSGYDEAIALDHNGHVAEGTVANLFIVSRGELITPDTATDLLEGITRSTVMSLAADLGISVRETSIDRSQLYIADEVFMCGSSARITPVLSIDKRPIGDGRVGPMTTKLMQRYDAASRGTTTDYADWCTPVANS